MFSYTPQINELLEKKFSSQTAFSQAMKKKEYYKFSSLTQQQFFKILSLESQKIFSELNSKKLLLKVQEMIVQEFVLDETQKYFQAFFPPSFKKEEYEKRKELFLNLNVSPLDLTVFKELKQLDSFSSKLRVPFKLITVDQKLESYFFDKYRLSLEYIPLEKLEESLEYFDSSTLMISDEYLGLEIEEYSKKDFELFLKGMILYNNKEVLLTLLKSIIEFEDEEKKYFSYAKKLGVEFSFNFDKYKLQEILSRDLKKELEQLSKRVLNLESEVALINEEVKKIISQKKLSLEGEELLELVNSGDLVKLQEKLQSETRGVIEEKQQELKQFFSSFGISLSHIFESLHYPLKIDDEIKYELEQSLDIAYVKAQISTYKELSAFEISQVKELFNFVYYVDLFHGIFSFFQKYQLNYPLLSQELVLHDGKNIFIEKPTGVSYGLGTQELGLKEERVGVLTGANSGGKTTLLEMHLQALVLSSLGFGICASQDSKIKFFDEIIYLKKFTGTQGSGAFEQTIRALLEIISKDNHKFLLIDEFEAVTEPGAAARILTLFLEQISQKGDFCIAASHLGQEIQAFIQQQNLKEIRIDGISAQGLDEYGNLITTHQPEFGKLGKSTPELILKRILNDELFWKNKSQDLKELLKFI